MLLRKLSKTFFRFIRKNFGIFGIKPYPMELDIIHESPEYLLINKPAHILTHPTKHLDPDTMLNGVLAYLLANPQYHYTKKQIRKEPLPGPVLRLDRDTSGIILFALSKEAKSKFGIMMMNKQFQKIYTTLVSGKTQEKGVIDTPLKKSEHSPPRMYATTDGLKSKTSFTRLAYYEKEDVSLLEVTLHTGRMHQIRVHLASIKHPVVGDILYGNTTINEKFFKNFGLKRQFLHASSLSFLDPFTKKNQQFTATLPSDLQSVCNVLER